MSWTKENGEYIHTDCGQAVNPNELAQHERDCPGAAVKETTSTISTPVDTNVTKSSE